jgi:hypothetical protein
MKRLRFPQVRQQSYLTQRYIRYLLSLGHSHQLRDITLYGVALLRKGRIRKKRLAIFSENLKQRQSTASARDKPTKKSRFVPVDDLLLRIDPITWFRRMKLCENSLLQGRQNLTRMLVASIDLDKESKLDRPYGWSSSTPLQRAYLTEGVMGSDVPIVLDTGASFSLSPFKSDFVCGPHECQVTEMTGIADKIMIEGIGTVEWPIVDIFGRCRTVRTQAYYVPAADIRLFSPQTFFQENGKGKCEVDFASITLTLPDETTLQFPFHPNSNLPFMLVQESTDLEKEVGLSGAHARLFNDSPTIESYLNLLDKDNINLAENQKELLLWHWRLMHAGQDWLQTLMATPKDAYGERPPAPIIPTKTSRVSSCVHPVCPACQLGKQHRRTPPGHIRHQADPDREMAIRRDDLRPGDCVSIDQYVSAFPGRLAHTYGKESLTDKYNGGTIFVDHATGFIYIKNQQSLRIGETLKAKHTFERFANEFGIKLKRFRADNAPF